jgi:Uma2 family endonuclease
MPPGLSGLPSAPLILSMRPPAKLTDEQLIAFCAQNRDLRIERTAEGDLILMPPVMGDGGIKSGELTCQLANWAFQNDTGRPFSSSSGFELPNGALRSPSAAWISRRRLASLTPEERKRFIPLCPEFVVELCSPPDELSMLKGKMREYMANGAQLTWLLDPKRRHVYVYRPGAPVQRLENPATFSGDPVLPGFTLDVQRVFDATF